ncbi:MULTISPECIES: small acid-soluble spore protein P [Paenibacillus]|nr:small acid-soluble spore protein P [Paenibacillus camelliae]MCM3634896.1 small acid-soluble spore protein P [Paenibacillus camelliae]
MAKGTDRNHSNKDHRANTNHQPNEPLSGSKKVKNANHSRNNHGEGS